MAADMPRLAIPQTASADNLLFYLASMETFIAQERAEWISAIEAQELDPDDAESTLLKTGVRVDFF